MNRLETKTKSGIAVTVEKFAGINEFLTLYENREISEPYKSHDTANDLKKNSYNKHDREFTSVKGYAEAVEQFKNGKNTTAIKTARANAVTGTKKEIKHSVNGGRVCVPSYLSGSPACMRRRVSKPAKTELNVIVDMGVPWYISADQIKDAGAQIVEYVTDLEQRYNVNVHACHLVSFNQKSSGKYRDCFMYSIKIKDAGKPFSAGRVSFCLTSPAFQRVFGFLWVTRAEGVPYAYGLGTSTTHNMEQASEVIDKVYKNSLFLSVLDVIRHGKDAFPIK